MDEYAIIGAGAFVTNDDAPAHGLVVGVLGRRIGWVCRCGVRLPDVLGDAPCSSYDTRYRIEDERVTAI